MGRSKSAPTLIGVLGSKIAVLIAVVGGIGALIVPTAASAHGDANRGNCPLETEASPGFRAFLPECRAFELVTPPYKEGGVVLDELATVSEDGSHVITGAGGAFAGAGNYWWDGNRNPGIVAYEFTRSQTGWQPTALTPPASEYPHSALMAVSAEDSGTTLWGAGQTKLLYHESIYRRVGSEPSEFGEVGPGTTPDVAEDKLLPGEELGFAGASRDLTHSLFQIEASGPNQRDAHEGHSDLWPGDTTEPQAYSLYEYVYAGAHDSEPNLVGVKNAGSLHGSPHINEGAEVISDCGTELGSGGRASAYNAVSANGEDVFFTAFHINPHNEHAPACTSPTVNELYARVNQSETVNISEPLLPAGECSAGEPCSGAAPQSAVFQGASEDGKRVFFESEQPLVNGAPAAGDKLYEATLEGSTISQLVNISTDLANGQSPEVQGVVRVAEHGERVYFVARGKLTGSDVMAGREPTEAEPQEGADNLYVYEPDSAQPGTYHTVFIATLLTLSEEAALETEEIEEKEGIETQAKNLYTYIYASDETEIIHKLLSGEIEILLALELLQEAEAEAKERESAFIQYTVGTLGPSGTLAADRRVWLTEDQRPAQATPSGESLVFLSSADLTEYDKSKVPQLFEYNAGDESLIRVSIGQGGPSSGNVDTFKDSPRIPVQSFAGVDRPTAADTGLAVSSDGSSVFFTSAASLAPQAETNTTNVYEYHAGDVYLISGGRDASLTTGSPTVQLFGIDPSGRDTFFLTADPLVPQDGETQMALYDAREEGGFPEAALEMGCIGETCRGTVGAAPQSQAPGSVSQTSGDNLGYASSLVVKPKTKAKQCQKGFVRKKGKCVRRVRPKKANAKRASDKRRVSR